MTDYNPGDHALKKLAKLKANPLNRPLHATPIANTPEAVHEVLATDHKPLLPFERDRLLGRLAEFGEEQRVLGIELGEAMSGTETFHDNPAAEAVADASTNLTDRAKAPITALHRSVLLDYPSPDTTVATLGSVVGVRYDDDPTTVESYLLTGFITGEARFTDDAPYDRETLCATVVSPLGASIVGKQVGEPFQYQVPAVHGAGVMWLHGMVENIAAVDPRFLQR